MDSHRCGWISLNLIFVFLWGNFSSGRWSFFLPGRVCRASLSARFNELKLDRAPSKTNWGFKMISWKDNTHFKINTILYHVSFFQNCLLSFLFVVFSHLPTCSSRFCRRGKKVKDAGKLNRPLPTVCVLLLWLWPPHTGSVMFDAIDCTSNHAYSAGQIKGCGPDKTDLRMSGWEDSWMAVETVRRDEVQ